MTFWHYTNGFAIFEILRDGAIKPGRPRDGERPAVFSTRAETYLTCDVCGTKIQTGNVCFAGCFRIGIDSETCPALCYWPEMVKRLKMSPRYASGRAAVCHAEHPRRWAASLAPVSLPNWTRVEYADDVERYHPLTLEILRASWRAGTDRLSDEIRRAHAAGEVRSPSLVDIDPEIAGKIESLGDWLRDLVSANPPDGATVLELLRAGDTKEIAQPR